MVMENYMSIVLRKIIPVGLYRPTFLRYCSVVVAKISVVFLWIGKSLAILISSGNIP